jgi:hypothetical protein
MLSSLPRILVLLSLGMASALTQAKDAMHLEEWNNLRTGHTVVDRSLRRFSVLMVEASGEGPAHILISSKESTLWTRNFSGFRRAPDQEVHPIDFRQMEIGESYWAALLSSSMPERVRCGRIVRTQAGWFIETLEGRSIDEKEILWIFEGSHEGYHSACLALVHHLETEMEKLHD